MENICRILLVEDEQAHQDLILRSFRRSERPFLVGMAGSLEEAYAELEHSSISLVVTDNNLPDGSGVDLIAALKGRCPVVVMTSHGSEAAAVDVMKAGAIDYIIKSPEAFADMPHIADRALRSWQTIQEKLSAESKLRAANKELEALMQERTSQLESSQTNYWEVVSSVNVIIMRWSELGVFHFVNPFGLSFFGVKAEDMVGKAVHAIQFPKWEAASADLGLFLQSILAKNGLGSSSVEPVRRGDGSVAWVSWTNHVLPLGRTGVREILSIGLDNTDQHRLQEELSRAKEIAEHANLAKSSFLANMSHEIRTPMNAILGMTHLAMESTVDAKLQGYLSKAEDSAKYLLRILNDILDFSKIEAGKLDLEQTSFNMREVVDRIGNMMGLRAQEKGLELVFDLSPNVPSQLLGDPLRLGQILINLVSNAVKFTESGEVRLNISRMEGAESEADVAHLQFEVFDTGVGMNAHQISLLFQPFQQGDSSTTRRFGGTGLGLSISRRLVNMMQGRIVAMSEQGKGSCFAFDIKLAIDPRSKEFMADPDSASFQKQSIRLDGARILLVEDNAISSEVVLNILRNLGAIVELAENGQRAIEMVNENPFDLVLMDCLMPVMDGYEATKRLRADPKFHELPIIAMTASALMEDRARCILAGMNEHISKPINVNEMLEKISCWLSEQSPSGAMSSPAEVRSNIVLGENENILLDAGVSVKMAIERLAGEWEIYRNMLAGFCRGQSGAMDLVQQALTNGDKLAAVRHAHTLKGLAGFIGSNEVAELARKLESILVDDVETPDAYIAELRNDLHRLIGAISRYLERFPQEHLGIDSLATVDIDKLHRLLLACDGEAVELAREFARQHEKEAGGELTRRVAQRASRYDFAQASLLLDEWISLRRGK